MEIKNLDRLEVKLNALKNMQISTVLNECCLLVENDAKRRCPVDSGQLRNSITHEVIDGNVGRVGTNVEYAPYVEYGTGLFSSKGNGRQTPWSYQDAQGNWHRTSGQKPQPYLQPALDSNRRTIMQKLKDGIHEEVEDIAQL